MYQIRCHSVLGFGSSRGGVVTEACVVRRLGGVCLTAGSIVRDGPLESFVLRRTTNTMRRVSGELLRVCEGEGRHLRREVLTLGRGRIWVEGKLNESSPARSIFGEGDVVFCLLVVMLFGVFVILLLRGVGGGCFWW